MPSPSSPPSRRIAAVEQAEKQRSPPPSRCQAPTEGGPASAASSMASIQEGHAALHEEVDPRSPWIWTRSLASTKIKVQVNDLHKRLTYWLYVDAWNNEWMLLSP